MDITNKKNTLYDRQCGLSFNKISNIKDVPSSPTRFTTKENSFIQQPQAELG